MANDTTPARGEFLTGDSGWAEGVAWRHVGPCLKLICPVCGDNYVGVNHELEDVLGWEAKEQLPADDKTPDWAGRGNGVRMLAAGECGHAWYLYLCFHKGETFLFAARCLGDAGRGDGPDVPERGK